MFLDVTYDQLIAVYKNKYIMINCLSEGTLFNYDATTA